MLKNEKVKDLNAGIKFRMKMKGKDTLKICLAKCYEVKDFFTNMTKVVRKTYLYITQVFSIPVCRQNDISGSRTHVSIQDGINTPP